MSKLLDIGVDIGSTTIKMIVMDKKKKVLFSAYERHYSDTKKTLIELLDKVLNEFEGNKSKISSPRFALASCLECCNS